MAVRVAPEAGHAPDELPSVGVESKHVVNIVDRAAGHGAVVSRMIFDSVYSANASQSAVYESTVRPLVAGALRGYSTTIMAYGAGGTGKSYSLEGTQEQHGILPRTIDQLISKLPDFNVSTDEKRAAKAACGVCISAIMITDAALYDMLASQSAAPLSIDHQTAFVAGVSQHEINDAADAFSVAAKARAYQAAYLARAKDKHAQVHVMYSLTVEKKGAKETVSGRLLLVDIHDADYVANSDIAQYMQKDHKTTDSRESLDSFSDDDDDDKHVAQSSGTSLDILRRVVAMAASPSLMRVPYRLTPLTQYAAHRDIDHGLISMHADISSRLLRDSIGGDCRTLMLVTIRPDQTHYATTAAALEFASRARGQCARMHAILS